MPNDLIEAGGVPAGDPTKPVPVRLSDGSVFYTSASALKRAVVALSATGDVVPAVAGKRIKVSHYALQSRADGMTVQFRDGPSGSLLGLRWGLNAREGAQSGAVTPPGFLFSTSAGNALQAVVTGTGTVDIEVSYWDSDES